MIWSTLENMYMLNVLSALFHWGDLWECQCHGSHAGQRWNLPHHPRARAEPGGSEEHAEPDAFLWHVRLLRTVCFPRKSFHQVAFVWLVRFRVSKTPCSRFWDMLFESPSLKQKSHVALFIYVIMDCIFANKKMTKVVWLSYVQSSELHWISRAQGSGSQLAVILHCKKFQESPVRSIQPTSAWV